MTSPGCNKGLKTFFQTGKALGKERDGKWEEGQCQATEKIILNNYRTEEVNFIEIIVVYN